LILHANGGTIAGREFESMAILQVRDLDDRIYESLRRLSRQHKRSISQEVTEILESYLAQTPSDRSNTTDAFLELAGAWEDERSAQSIVSDLREHRSTNTRFSGSDGIPD
jgi:plasmid stability protein